MNPVISVDHLKAYYITRAYGVERTVRAVEDISLAIRQNEIYGLAGESGCGKSTLLKVLLGQVEPPLTVLDGSVTYHLGDETIDALHIPKSQLSNIRWKEVAYVPQGSMHVLNPVRRIRDSFRDYVMAHSPRSREETDALVLEYINRLGLPARVLGAYPHQLSGGMRQRVTIALATILRPRLAFADEPTTALDVVVQKGVIQLLREVQAMEKNTMVVVTHDMGVHANLADRIGILYAGTLVEEAPTREIFKAPRHPYTRYLIKSLPALDDKSERVSIPGRPPALDNPPGGCRFHPRCPYVMDICKTTIPRLEAVAPSHRVACFLETGNPSNATQPLQEPAADLRSQ